MTSGNSASTAPWLPDPVPGICREISNVNLRLIFASCCSNYRFFLLHLDCGIPWPGLLAYRSQ